MRSGFGGHLNTSPFGITDKRNTCFGADMADMNRLVKSGGKCNFFAVPQSSAILLGRRSVLTFFLKPRPLILLSSARNKSSQCATIVISFGAFLHCVTQILCVFNRSAVIGNIAPALFTECCGFFAFKPLRLPT